MGKTRYDRNPLAVVRAQFLIVWPVMYRRELLIGEVATRLKKLLAEKARAMALRIRKLKILPAHVELIIDFDERWALAPLVAQLKAYSSPILRKEFPELRKKLPSLWTRAYFACSPAEANEIELTKFLKVQTKMSVRS